VKVYLSGPISGQATYLVEFAAAAARVRAAGHEPLSPIDIPACATETCLGERPVDAALRSDEYVHAWACYLRYDLAAMLLKCDAIYLLPGWANSEGAFLEFQVARAMKFKIFWPEDFR
jgi:hypothetical protein